MKRNRLTAALGRWYGLLLVAVAGGVVAAAGVLLRPREAWVGVATAALFGLSIVLGCGTFVALQGAAGATWWLPLRRVPTSILAALPVPAVVLAVALLFGLSHVYPWAGARAGEALPLAHGKARWLSAPLFLLRAGLILAAWAAAIVWLRRTFDALRPGAERAGAGASVAFLLLLGPTITLTSFDWAMSVEPSWYSTAYGVYGFASSFQAGIAAIAALSPLLLPEDARGPKIRHDLGKLLFAFSIFWAYIWFCQYMLIWYANLPEEVPHYTHRLARPWAPLFWLPPLLCFVVPFIALLSARAKRIPAVLATVSIVVLAGRWLDVYVQIAPDWHPTPPAPLYSLAAGVAVLAGMALLVHRAWRRRAPAHVAGD